MLEYFLIVSTSFLLSMAVLSLARNSSMLKKRLAELRNSPSRGDSSDGMSVAGEKTYSSAVKRLQAVVDWLGSIEWLRALRKESGADISSTALLLRILYCSAGGTLFTATVTGNTLFAGLGGSVMGTLPLCLLARKRKRRLARIEAALPSAIDLMARSLRAGHSLGAAFEILASSCPKPLNGEFAHVSQQQKLGVMFRESITELASRVPSHDLRFLVTGILLQHESGGDLTEMLDTIRAVIADRARVAGLLKVHSAQGRFTGWVLSALPLALLGVMYFVNRSYVSVLWTEHAGRVLLLACFVCVAIGLAIIRKIVAVKQ